MALEHNILCICGYVITSNNQPYTQQTQQKKPKKTTSQLRDEFNTTNFMYIYFNLPPLGGQTQPHKTTEIIFT